MGMRLEKMTLLEKFVNLHFAKVKVSIWVEYNFSFFSICFSICFFLNKKYRCDYYAIKFMFSVDLFIDKSQVRK